MEMESTLWLLGIGIAVMLAAIGGDRLRRRAPFAWHAHLPWNAMAFLGLAGSLLAAVHLFSLVRMPG